ncbi:hypothetical protein Hbor_09530 [Halogeometricum borinquense DSM 11551]|uniref:Uncharacterized protein n=1 Tax=Halogeometricum borinquense (strain ATCC 700274 / DSM 11551 / JCM 10706 / KCTC 4070 / PR3) TaxID=469382 RepID=E4NPR4_HALBP|nr:hypothetical protein Hbor_09530 [Halogeometricum borinquense DSM 11551]
MKRRGTTPERHAVVTVIDVPLSAVSDIRYLRQKTFSVPNTSDFGGKFYE